MGCVSRFLPKRTPATTQQMTFARISATTSNRDRPNSVNRGRLEANLVGNIVEKQASRSIHIELLRETEW